MKKENKIIDFDRKCNMVRFYLGKNDLKEWYGDDWDDAPYEHNAGKVYEEFVTGHKDITFNFDDIVVEPCEGGLNSSYCKDDMKARKMPCIVVLKKEDQTESDWLRDFESILANDKSIKFYFGDKLNN